MIIQIYFDKPILLVISTRNYQVTLVQILSKPQNKPHPFVPIQQFGSVLLRNLRGKVIFETSYIANTFY